MQPETDTPEPMHALSPTQLNIKLNRRDRPLSGCQTPAHGTHEAVTMLQHRVASDLMSRPMGTALDVRGTGECYFLAPEANDSGQTMGLYCAPIELGGIVYSEAIDAWLSPYAGGVKLEDVEMALRVALWRARYHDVDFEAARTAMDRHHAPVDKAESSR